jgi:hypothetical protein
MWRPGDLKGFETLVDKANDGRVRTRVIPCDGHAFSSHGHPREERNTFGAFIRWAGVLTGGSGLFFCSCFPTS